MVSPGIYSCLNCLAFRTENGPARARTTPQNHTRNFPAQALYSPIMEVQVRQTADEQVWPTKTRFRAESVFVIAGLEVAQLCGPVLEPNLLPGGKMSAETNSDPTTTVLAENLGLPWGTPGAPQSIRGAPGYPRASRGYSGNPWGSPHVPPGYPGGATEYPRGTLGMSIGPEAPQIEHTRCCLIEVWL
jgi:hypothetical protein